MKRQRHVTLLAAFAVSSASCFTRPATQVILTIDSDAVPMQGGADLSVQANAQGALHGLINRFTIGYGTGAVSLPMSIGLLPGDHPNDTAAVVEVTLVAYSPGLLPTTVRRRARFSFVPDTTTHIRLFLRGDCGAVEGICTTSACTVQAHCEEQGLACGDDATCVPLEVMSVGAEE